MQCMTSCVNRFPLRIVGGRLAAMLLAVMASAQGVMAQDVSALPQAGIQAAAADGVWDSSSELTVADQAYTCGTVKLALAGANLAVKARVNDTSENGADATVDLFVSTVDSDVVRQTMIRLAEPKIAFYEMGKMTNGPTSQLSVTRQPYGYDMIAFIPLSFFGPQDNVDAMEFEVAINSKPPTAQKAVFATLFGSVSAFRNDDKFRPLGFALAEGRNAVKIDIEAREVICDRFLGFGAEWDSNNYRDAGIRDEDFRVIRERVEWMRLPIARIMMQAKWCYKGNDTYDFDDPQMQALYRHLDLCQKLGTRVMLTDWGVKPSWLKCPDVARVDDTKYAEIIGVYMDHLLNKKGYTCIKHFILVNEPNYEVGDWEEWKKGVQNVHAQFQKRGFADRILFTGSDHAHEDKWHQGAVDQLQGILGAYDIHRYTQMNELREGGVQTYFQKAWDYALQKDPQAAAKPRIVAEAGIWMNGSSASTNPAHKDYEYGLQMADYAVQAANAGSWAVLAWMLDDNSHPDFTWGMWASKTNGLALKPWFYPWSLLCRYVPAGSHIVKAGPEIPDVRVLAAQIPGDKDSKTPDWTFCLVNRSCMDRTVRLQLKDGPHGVMKRYVYSKTSTKTDQNGFPLPLDENTYNLATGMDIQCEVGSVVILTSLNP